MSVAAIDLALQFAVHNRDSARQTDRPLVDVLEVVDNLHHNYEIGNPERGVFGLFSTALDRRIWEL